MKPGLSTIYRPVKNVERGFSLMCNACGFLCCGSDQFGKCGCDHCECPECWDDEDEKHDDYFDMEEALEKAERYKP